MTARHVVLGLAHPRATWPAELARWSTTGVAPIEFMTCLTADEVRATLTAGRRASAVLLDGGSMQVDRDLVAAVAAADAAPIGVHDSRLETDWDALGCRATLPADFDPTALLDVLRRHSAAMEHGLRPERRSAMRLDTPDRSGDGAVVAISGSGGSGASTVAVCLAQGFAAVDARRSVVLVDGARRGDLAMYHDVGDILPGLPELVERSRRVSQDPGELAELTFDGASRGYELLLGLRRPRDWAAHRRRAMGAAFEVLSRAHRSMVVDHDGDLDREGTTGSTDIEDRNAVSLVMAESADVWVIVGRAGLKGMHDMARRVDEAAAAGVPPSRIVPVFNRSARAPRGRTSVAALPALGGAEPTSGVVQLPDMRRIEGIHHDCARMPRQLVDPVTAAVTQVLHRHGRRPQPSGTSPGSATTERAGTAGRVEISGALAVTR